MHRQVAATNFRCGKERWKISRSSWISARAKICFSNDAQGYNNTPRLHGTPAPARPPLANRTFFLSQKSNDTKLFFPRFHPITVKLEMEPCAQRSGRWIKGFEGARRYLPRQQSTTSPKCNVQRYFSV
jgi:hypothetical protein